LNELCAKVALKSAVELALAVAAAGAVATGCTPVVPVSSLAGAAVLAARDARLEYNEGA
jgi:hypothetical protein